jgi:FtsH-binding integral membrane protein
MTSPARPKRPFGLGTFILMMIGVAVVGGVAGGAAATIGDQPGSLGMALTAALIAVAMAIAFVFCIWWWRGIDEAAREAHKWAWWWGGSSGMALGAILILTLSLRDEDISPLSADASAADLVSGGVFAILLFQMAGYGIAWAVWWLKHR